jgi:hypothetical protein
MRTVNLFAALAASCLAGVAADAYAASGYDPGSQSASGCGSGYHPDAGGYCQPDNAEVSRYCPEGQVYHPAPNGWVCEIPETAAALPPRPEPPRLQLQPRPVHAVRERERPHVTRQVVREVAPQVAREATPHAAPRARVARRAVVSAAATPQRNDPPRAESPPVAPVSAGETNFPQISGGGGGGGGGGWSDRRLKRDIVRLGASPSGLPIYSFQYVWGGPRYVGVMAQDMLKLRPDAVIYDESGYYKVDYSRIDVDMREEEMLAA